MRQYHNRRLLGRQVQLLEWDHWRFGVKRWGEGIGRIILLSLYCGPYELRVFR